MLTGSTANDHIHGAAEVEPQLWNAAGAFDSQFQGRRARSLALTDLLFRCVMSRQLTIDLTDAASDELDRLRALTNLSSADVFRHAFNVFRIVVEEQRQKNAIHLSGDRLLELPFDVKFEE